MIPNKFDEASMKSMLNKGTDTTFIHPQTENLYHNYSWEHFRKVYTLAGSLLFLFTVYLTVSMAYYSMETLSQIPMIIIIVASFLVQITLMSFWKKKDEPKYLNLAIPLLSTLMSAIYLISIEPGTEQFHEQLLRLSIINSLGMIFLSNGRIFLILLNICILVVPINIILFLFHEHGFIWRMIPVFLGLSSFLIFLDNYSRRSARLNWYRQISMDRLNSEMTQIASDALAQKSQVEAAAAQNVDLIEQIFSVNEEIERKNQFLHDLIEGIPLGIVVLDSKATVLAHNKKVLELLSLNDEEGLLDEGKSLKVIIDALRKKEGHHSPRFWASYDEIISQKINPTEGRTVPLIKADFKMESGTFLSFIEVPVSGGRNILIAQDITYRKEIESDMRMQALTDSLTGLANRHDFDLKFEDAIERNHRNKTSLGLAIIDLDRFKPINDRHGHPVGDKILKYVGKTLREQVRTVDLPCRLGGDEFAVLFTDIKPDNPPTIACNRILEALNKKIQIDGIDLDLGASIGLAFSNSPEINSTQFIKEADKALYRAKEGGRGSLEVVQTTI